MLIDQVLCNVLFLCLFIPLGSYDYQQHNVPLAEITRQERNKKQTLDVVIILLFT